MTATTTRSLPAWGRWLLYVVLFVPVSYLVVDLTTTLSTIGYPECDEPGDACTQSYAGFFLGLLVIAALVVGILIGETVTAVRHLRRRRSA